MRSSTTISLTRVMPLALIAFVQVASRSSMVNPVCATPHASTYVDSASNSGSPSAGSPSPTMSKRSPSRRTRVRKTKSGPSPSSAAPVVSNFMLLAGVIGSLPLSEITEYPVAQSRTLTAITAFFSPSELTSDRMAAAMSRGAEVAG